MSLQSGVRRWLATAGAPLAASVLALSLLPGVAAAQAPASQQHIQTPSIQAPPILATGSWAGMVEAAATRRAVDAEAHALAAQAAAQRSVADRRFAGPLEADASARQDAIGSGTGYRELEGGISAPLWRGGERAAVRGQADGLAALADARLSLARLAIASDVRAAWCALATARAELRVAREQVGLAVELTASTRRLVDAGEQARLDLLQAQGAQAQAEAALASAEGRAAQAQAQLAGLVGTVPATLPTEAPGALAIDDHPLVREALADAAQLTRQATLARLQGTPGWRVGLDARSERDGRGIDTRTSTGVRISRPLGANPASNAEAATLEAQASAARRRAEAARLSVEAARTEAAAGLSAARAAATAGETRQAALAEALTLTERGWREGELSFLELIRARVAAADASREAAVARVAADAALSTFNQAQGLLPQDAQR
jgi:outer membrane protein, heavy metal efflux system